MKRKYLSMLVLGLSLLSPMVLPASVWANDSEVEAVVRENNALGDARGLSSSGNFQAAAVPYAEAVGQDYENPSLMIEAGINALAAGLTQSALDYAKPVLTVDPTNSEALHLMGQILVQKEDYRRAKNFVADAIMFDSQNVTYITTLVLLDAKLGNIAEATAGAEKLLKIDAKNLDALRLLAQFYLSEKNVAMVEDSWGRIVEAEPTLENIAQYAKSLQILNEKGRAELVCRSAIQMQPDSYLAYAMFGDFLFQTLDYEGAARMFFIGSMKTQDSDLIAYSHGKMSRSFFKLGEIEEAKKEMITCLNRNPNEYEGLLTKAKLFLQADMLKEGREALAFLQEQGANDSEYYFALATMNNAVHPSGTEADELLAVARQMNPGEPEFMILEARRLLMVEDLGNAEILVKGSLDIMKGDSNLIPLFVQAYVVLSDIYVAAKDFNAAISIRENLSKAGLRSKKLDVRLYEVYVKAGRLDDARKHLSIFQESLSKEELTHLEGQIKKAPLPDDPEGAINKQ